MRNTSIAPVSDGVLNMFDFVCMTLYMVNKNYLRKTAREKKYIQFNSQYIPTHAADRL